MLVLKCSSDIEQYVEFKISGLISPSKSLISSRWVTFNTSSDMKNDSYFGKYVDLTYVSKAAYQALNFTLPWRNYIMFTCDVSVLIPKIPYCRLMQPHAIKHINIQTFHTCSSQSKLTLVKIWYIGMHALFMYVYILQKLAQFFYMLERRIELIHDK